MLSFAAEYGNNTITLNKKDLLAWSHPDTDHVVLQGTLNASPATVRAGADAVVALRGVNLAPSSAVRAGGETLPAVLTEGDLQTLRVVMPARLLSTAGVVTLEVFDRDAATEPSTAKEPHHIAPRLHHLAQDIHIHTS